MKLLFLVVVFSFLSVVFPQTSCPRCTKLCQNGDGTTKTCGSDGCGGSCGSCATNQQCCYGSCVCTPNCQGVVCGNDGCGGSACGVCSASQTCSNGACVGTATPACAGKTCGDNTAGGSCGSCSSGQRCRGGNCACYYDCNDSNCGLAVQPAGTNSALCPPISCGTCPSGFTCGTNGTCSALVPCTVTVLVFNCATTQPLGVTSTISITGTGYSFSLAVPTSGSATWTTPGTGSFTFVTSATGYLTSTTTQTVTVSTTIINVCLTYNLVQVDVRDQSSNTRITSNALVSWTGVTSGSFQWTQQLFNWADGGYGTYNFTATPVSNWNPGNLVVNVQSTTTLIIIYVQVSLFCGDGICSQSIGETSENCPADCIGLFMEFENADGSGPVNGPTVNYYATDPRTYPQSTGPEKNPSVLPISNRTTGNASNTVYQDVFNYNVPIYTETINTGFITFYWVTNISTIYQSVGAYTLRAHLSASFTATSYNYRFVNTWRTTDNQPAPYAPTTLDLTLFHPNGPLDINNPALIVGGIQIGNAVANSKQSGGPATMDISPGAGIMIAVWDAKPPRNPVIAPSQAGRYIVDSGAYIVVYGKTSDASTGKQLGQVIIPQNDSDHVSDVWYAMQATISKPAQDQPNIVAQNKFQVSTIDANNNMFYNCEAYAYCVDFEIPYSDTGR